MSVAPTITACENVCQDFRWFPQLMDVLADVGTLLVGIGVIFAYQQVNAWKKQLKHQKRVETAELVLADVLTADEALSYIEGTLALRKKDNELLRERLAQRDTDLNKLQHAKVRAQALLGDDDVSKSIDVLLQVRQRLWEKAHPELLPLDKRISAKLSYEIPTFDFRIFAALPPTETPYAKQRSEAVQKIAERLGAIIQMKSGDLS
ncbi:MAG: hypothetical protein R3D85_17300 [Paracoccaceae bacterium]